MVTAEHVIAPSGLRTNFKYGLLKKVRLSKNISLYEAGSYIGVSPQAYRNRENGIVELTVNELNLLLHGFGVPLEDYHKFFSMYPTPRGSKDDYDDTIDGYID